MSQNRNLTAWALLGLTWILPLVGSAQEMNSSKWSTPEKMVRKMEIEIQNSTNLVRSRIPVSTILSAKSGGGSDGGGNALVCFDSPAITAEISKGQPSLSKYIETKYISHIVSVEMLDLYRARRASITADGEQQSVKIFNSTSSDDLSSYSNLLRRRIETLVPMFGKRLQEGADLVQGVVAFPEGLTASFQEDDVDSEENIANSNCLRSTIISQVDVPEEGTQVLIDARIFQLPKTIFPISSQLTGFWHEFLYASARRQRLATSDLIQVLLGDLQKNETTVSQIVSDLDQLYPKSSNGSGSIQGASLLTMDELTRLEIIGAAP